MRFWRRSTTRSLIPAAIRGYFVLTHSDCRPVNFMSQSIVSMVARTHIDTGGTSLISDYVRHNAGTGAVTLVQFPVKCCRVECCGTVSAGVGSDRQMPLPPVPEHSRLSENWNRTARDKQHQMRSSIFSEEFWWAKTLKQDPLAFSGQFRTSSAPTRDNCQYCPFMRPLSS